MKMSKMIAGDFQELQLLAPIKANWLSVLIHLFIFNYLAVDPSLVPAEGRRLVGRQN